MKEKPIYVYDLKELVQKTVKEALPKDYIELWHTVQSLRNEYDDISWKLSEVRAWCTQHLEVKKK